MECSRLELVNLVFKLNPRHALMPQVRSANISFYATKLHDALAALRVPKGALSRVARCHIKESSLVIMTACVVGWDRSIVDLAVIFLSANGSCAATAAALLAFGTRGSSIIQPWKPLGNAASEKPCLLASYYTMCPWYDQATSTCRPSKRRATISSEGWFV